MEQDDAVAPKQEPLPSETNTLFVTEDKRNESEFPDTVSQLLRTVLSQQQPTALSPDTEGPSTSALLCPSNNALSPMAPAAPTAAPVPTWNLQQQSPAIVQPPRPPATSQVASPSPAATATALDLNNACPNLPSTPLIEQLVVYKPIAYRADGSVHCMEIQLAAATPFTFPSGLPRMWTAVPEGQGLVVVNSSTLEQQAATNSMLQQQAVVPTTITQIPEGAPQAVAGLQDKIKAEKKPRRQPNPDDKPAVSPTTEQLELLGRLYSIFGGPQVSIRASVRVADLPAKMKALLEVLDEQNMTIADIHNVSSNYQKWCSQTGQRKPNYQFNRGLFGHRFGEVLWLKVSGLWQEMRLAVEAKVGQWISFMEDRHEVQERIEQHQQQLDAQRYPNVIALLAGDTRSRLKLLSEANTLDELEQLAAAADLCNGGQYAVRRRKRFKPQ